MRLLHNWCRHKDQVRPVSFLRNMNLQTSVQSILVSTFRISLLRLSAGTYEATFSTAANVVSHFERF